MWTYNASTFYMSDSIGSPDSIYIDSPNVGTDISFIHMLPGSSAA